MKTNQLLGVAGGGAMAIGTFLPLVSVFGMSFSLFSIPGQTIVAVLFILLGAAGAFTAFKGGKTMSIVSLACGAIGALLLLIKIEFNVGFMGIGGWIMLLGGILMIAGGAMGMKSAE